MSEIMQTNNVLKELPSSPEICRDFINGKCTRSYCKYTHVKINKPVSCNTSQFIQPPINNVLNKYYVPSKTHVFLNLNNFINQKHYNGIFICNMSDIIPTCIIDKLLQFGNKPFSGTSENAYMYIQSVTPECITKLKAVINWTMTNTEGFDKTNYATIFVYDICESLNKFIIQKGWSKHKNNIIIDTILYYLNIMFGHIFNELLNYNISGINVIVNYFNDELTLFNRYIIEFLHGIICTSADTYISPQMHNNIYYIGNQPNLNENISDKSNKGFVFCYVSNTKYINLADIYTRPTTANTNKDVQTCSTINEALTGIITKSPDCQISNMINEYCAALSKHNTNIYNMIFIKNQQIKKMLYNTIVSGCKQFRPNSVVIIGCNLDTVFDQQILTGLKETLGSINFNELHSNDSANKQNKLGITDKLPSKTTASEDDCCTPNSAGTIVSVVLPIFTSEPSTSQQHIRNNTGDNTGLNAETFNAIIKNLAAHTTIGNNNTLINTKFIQNTICTINLNLVKTHNNDISTNQPFDMIQGITKIKEYGNNPNNKIIIVCSPRMTHKYFTEFITQITRTPGYPNKINSQFIDFTINPGIRSCMAYHNYRVINKSYLTGNLGNDVPIIKNHKLWYNLCTFVNIIKGYAAIPQTTTNTLSTDDTDKCCKCCSCLSRNGVIYTTFGNIPYIPLDILNNITDDSWLPRL